MVKGCVIGKRDTCQGEVIDECESYKHWKELEKYCLVCHEYVTDVQKHRESKEHITMLDLLPKHYV